MPHTLPPPAPANTITAMMLREMSTSFGRSPGGYIWAVAEPVAAISLMAYVFSVAFPAPMLGRDFFLFYATGYLPFMLFLDVVNKIGTAVRFSRPLLAYPAVTLMDALIARWVLNVGTHLVVFVLVMTGIEVARDTGAIYAAPAILNALAMAAALAAGIGLLNAWLIARLPVWERFWGMVTRPLFVVSGVFFTYESLPPVLRDIAWYNPLMHITAAMRSGAYPGYDAAFVSAPFVYGVALACGVTGLMLIYTAERDIIHG